ncbi:hypothetical protein IMG5_002690 [Ichthyophthirius multifiliis]|uniref:FAD dependent oxidoreductase domain-containing protein n=1 Tax=Ichthyophthirius multifiliis TaxID=5932 RepID=G0QJ55_ICHMU|nr:hypothetical protein IMG5_002690 [Ichthyophthirius multifiliis]EGR34736.1 hypothetical protein IMG5_002690 [Ichthyophthirius multifiliis]|eukprot:XP_004040040.1 hypothetical protein IMG5_002690 [Ichthyophthirius multifiliis]
MQKQQIPQKPQKVIKLPIPEINFSKILGQKSGLRPYRKGGVRIEEQKIQNKLFFHNYGYGGAGISISYGYTKLLFAKFDTKYSSDIQKEVAIIGAGYAGLYTAIECAKSGYKVTIYADNFVHNHQNTPQDLHLQAKQQITSQVGAGLWCPLTYDYDSSEEIKERHNLCSRISYDYYKNLIQRGSHKGISFKKIITVNHLEGNKDYSYKRNIVNGIIDDYEEVLITFNGVDMAQGEIFTTILIEGDIFLNELVNECKKYGVIFINQHFESLDQIIQIIPQKFIFNCSSMSSRKFFQDENLVPIKGQLVVLEKINNVDFFLNIIDKKGTELSLYPNSNYTLLGYVKLYDRWDNQPEKYIGDFLVQNIKQYFQEAQKKQKF